jgi:hypothetical protein
MAQHHNEAPIISYEVASAVFFGALRPTSTQVFDQLGATDAPLIRAAMQRRQEMTDPEVGDAFMQGVALTLVALHRQMSITELLDTMHGPKQELSSGDIATLFSEQTPFDESTAA